MAEFTASYAGAETEIADANRVILELVGEVVATFGHGANEYADAFLGSETTDVVLDANNLGVEGQSYLAAVVGKMVGDGILDDSEEFLLRGGRADGEPVQQLHH